MGKGFSESDCAKLDGNVVTCSQGQNLRDAILEVLRMLMKDTVATQISPPRLLAFLIGYNSVDRRPITRLPSAPIMLRRFRYGQPSG